jgi:hypothetical protein
MRLLLCTLLLLLAAAAAAQNSGIDRRFGNNGIASLRDLGQPGARHLGLAACAAPGGGLNVLAATEAARLTLFRLRKDGSLDPGFGIGGIVTMTVPESGEDTAQGACMADGRIVVARMAPGTGSDRNTQLLRVLPEGGLESTFGAGGVRILDFDQHVAGLGDLEFPLGLNLDASGSLLVTLRLFRNDGQSRPGLASVDSSGTVRFARLYDPPGVTAVYATAAGLGPNGRIWLVGGGNPSATPFYSWFRTEHDPLTGELLATFIGAEGNYVVDGGRVLSNGVMVVVGKYVPQSDPGGPYRPRLLVFRASGANHVELPPPAPVNNSAPTLAPFLGFGVAIPIAGNRVLFGSPMGGNNQEWELATYAAVVELGASAAEDRVDTRFGSGGATQFAYRTETPCANGSPTRQRPVRFSNWLGRPVLAGIHSITCNTDPRAAFAARLLLPTDVFIDSFED